MPQDEIAKVAELIKDARIAMLTTVERRRVAREPADGRAGRGLRR